MKNLYAVSSIGKTLKSFLDVRFGRCESVVVFDPIKKDYQIINNPYKNSKQAGIKLVDFLLEKGVKVIITGEVGPVVQEKLMKNKIQLVLLEEERIKINEIISRIRIPG